MSKHRAHAATRRTPGPRSERAGAHAAPRGGPASALRGTVVMTSAALAATGAVVSGGVLGGDAELPAIAAGPSAVGAQELSGAGAGATAPSPLGAEAAERVQGVSRSDRRTSTDPAKVEALSGAARPAVSHTEDLSQEDPRTVAMALLPEFGFSADQFACLDPLYMGESGWRWNADNPSSSAYGIPQALPGSKMSSAGSDWATNPVTQIRWGLGYIADRYGTPCSAWSFKQGHGWY